LFVKTPVPLTYVHGLSSEPSCWGMIVSISPARFQEGRNNVGAEDKVLEY
jgi:hypothetical protein